MLQSVYAANEFDTLVFETRGAPGDADFQFHLLQGDFAERLPRETRALLELPNNPVPAFLARITEDGFSSSTVS